MASTEQLPNGRWRGIYRDAAGRRRSKTFDHKRAALRWATLEEDKARRGNQADPHGAKTLWKDWYSRWDPTRHLAASTRRAGATRVDRHVLPRWGPIPLGAITRLDVQRWVTTELPAAGLSASSIRQCYYVLSASLRAATHNGLLETSPCAGVRLPTLPPGRDRYLDDTELQRIVYQLAAPYQILVELLVGTGMRISEAAGLHRARVDLDALTIRVAEVWDVRSRKMRPFPKGKRARTVPISPGLADRLARWLDTHPATGDCGQPHTEGRCPGPLVLTGPGRWVTSLRAPIDPHNFTNRVWPAAIRGTGLPDADGQPTVEPVPHCTPHDLRHTYASRLVRRGIELARIRDLLGHASITTTERYAHLAPGRFDTVRAALTSPAEQDHGTAHGTPTDPTRPHLDTLTRPESTA